MDLDQDGRVDVLSGCWPGEVHLFRGVEGGGFAEGVTLRGPGGAPLKADKASVAHAFDWDGDGDLDLVLGGIGGAVWVARNETAEDGLVFGAPAPLEADGKPIHADGGDSAPFVADWDADG